MEYCEEEFRLHFFPSLGQSKEMQQFIIYKMHSNFNLEF